MSKSGQGGRRKSAEKKRITKTLGERTSLSHGPQDLFSLKKMISRAEH